MARRLQRQLQANYDGIPDICTGFELIIDEIPNGRDSCDCDGVSVNCLFTAVCPQGHEDNKECMDAVEYVVSFEDGLITVLSCALVAEADFEETCAKVSLADNLQLGECILGTYGGLPCDCSVCEGQGSLLLDCTEYDSRAITNCQAAGIGEIAPLSHGFNKNNPSGSDSLEGGSSMEDDDIASDFPEFSLDSVDEEVSGARNAAVLFSLLSVTSTVAVMF